MHGLVNRSIECFLRHTGGKAMWQAVAAALGPGFERFEAMFVYDDAVTTTMIARAAELCAKPEAELLEDLGTYLVVDPRAERVRRLLRFGGVDYEDFLQSLEDLRGRGRLAVPDLDLPSLELTGCGGGEYLLRCESPYPGFGHVLVGVLRAMADDYGALVVLDHKGRRNGAEQIAVTLLDARHAKGRRFDLAQKVG